MTFFVGEPGETCSQTTSLPRLLCCRCQPGRPHESQKGIDLPPLYPVLWIQIRSDPSYFFGWICSEKGRVLQKYVIFSVLRIQNDIVTRPDPDPAPNIQNSGSRPDPVPDPSFFSLKVEFVKNLTCRSFAPKYLPQIVSFPLLFITAKHLRVLQTHILINFLMQSLNVCRIRNT